MVGKNMQWRGIKRRSDVFLTLSQSQKQPTTKCPLERNMQRAGLMLRRNVPTDGNCLFHAVSDQLKRLKLHRYRHRQLRDLAINQLRANPTVVNLFSIIILLKGRDYYSNQFLG